MSEFPRDGFCGLYCGGCDILRIYETSRETGVPPQWQEMPERFRNFRKETPIVCHGCKSDTLFAGCKICPIRRCARKRGEESCATCKKFPCLNFKIMNFVVRIRKMDRALPHITVRPKNLETIQQKGLAAFIEEQERTWHCPQCQTRFSWYQETCSGCGRELETLKEWC